MLRYLYITCSQILQVHTLNTYS